MRILNKLIYISFIVFLPFILLNCSDSEKKMPVSPIFSDVENIQIGQTATDFTFYLPEDVYYAVLGVFDVEIETQGNTIINELDFEGGNRTGLSGFTRSGVPKNMIWHYEDSQNDFSQTVKYIPQNVVDHWAVWGYDRYGNLTHASGQLTVSP